MQYAINQRGTIYRVPKARWQLNVYYLQRLRYRKFCSVLHDIGALQRWKLLRQVLTPIINEAKYATVHLWGCFHSSMGEVMADRKVKTSHSKDFSEQHTEIDGFDNRLERFINFSRKFPVGLTMIRQVFQGFSIEAHSGSFANLHTCLSSYLKTWINGSSNWGRVSQVDQIGSWTSQTEAIQLWKQETWAIGSNWKITTYFCKLSRFEIKWKDANWIKIWSRIEPREQYCYNLN